MVQLSKGERKRRWGGGGGVIPDLDLDLDLGKTREREKMYVGWGGVADMKDGGGYIGLKGNIVVVPFGENGCV